MSGRLSRSFKRGYASPQFKRGVGAGMGFVIAVGVLAADLPNPRVAA
jgi:hypothetical protein